LTSDEKTLIPSLIAYIRSDLFTLDNISSSVKLSQDEAALADDDLNAKQWMSVISYLPLDFFRLIESFPDMYTVEKFDLKYAENPKLCAFDRYGLTNMWRPLMILNRCPSITKFNFEFIRYYNIEKFTQVLSVLIARCQSS
jgi:hypothetical protein